MKTFYVRVTSPSNAQSCYVVVAPTELGAIDRALTAVALTLTRDRAIESGYSAMAQELNVGDVVRAS